MKYELCKQAGLNLFKIETDHFPALIKASDVEEVLKKAMVVYGSKNLANQFAWFDGKSQVGCDTHTARVLLVEEIKKDPKKLQPWRDFAKPGKPYDTIFNSYMDHIEEVMRERLKEAGNGG